MKRNDLTVYLNDFLKPHLHQDYCPNGLQIEGKQQVARIVTGVTACEALIDKAIMLQADALLVHHGYFWKNESPVLIGIKKQRIEKLLRHGINLYAYHLPLDVHPEVGNNVALGKVLGMDLQGWLDDRHLVAYAELPARQSLETFSAMIARKLNREPYVVGDKDKMVKTVAWCTGAAQQYIETAIAANMDLFISGEVSEQTFHWANESTTAYIAAGHHATERYGVQLLGEHLAHKFGLTHHFVEIDNPF